MDPDKKNYCTLADLQKRGWTRTLIRRYLPEPTMMRFGKRKRSVKSWEKETVLTIEQTSSFQAAFEKAKRRKLSARKGIQTKTLQLRRDMLEDADNAEVKIYDEETLRNLTFHERTIWPSNASHKPDKHYGPVDAMTLERWKVNYLRHRAINYREILAKYKGRVGLRAVYPEFKVAILEHIARCYPNHEDECLRQILRTLKLAGID